MALAVLGANINTLIANARIGNFPEDLSHELDERKVQSQEMKKDLHTRSDFAGEILYMKPLGARRQ
jgi:hypothetical protein